MKRVDGVEIVVTETVDESTGETIPVFNAVVGGVASALCTLVWVLSSEIIVGGKVLRLGSVDASLFGVTRSPLAEVVDDWEPCEILEEFEDILDKSLVLVGLRSEIVCGISVEGSVSVVVASASSCVVVELILELFPVFAAFGKVLWEDEFDRSTTTVFVDRLSTVELPEGLIGLCVAIGLTWRDDLLP